MTLNLPSADYAAYIFDCDGTLADTMPIHYRAWQKALKDFPTTLIFDEDEFYRLGGMSAQKIVELFNQREGTHYDAVAVAHFKEAIFLEMLHEVRPIQPVVDLAKKYYDEGKPLAVASGGMRHIVLRTLGFLGIENLFRVVVTPEDVLHGKPAPDLYLLAAKRLNTPPASCLVFEDTPTGIAAADAAGMDHVFVPSRT